eukprot:4224431-Prymnesium_polylepis.1
MSSAMRALRFRGSWLFGGRLERYLPVACSVAVGSEGAGWTAPKTAGSSALATEAAGSTEAGAAG